MVVNGNAIVTPTVTGLPLTAAPAFLANVTNILMCNVLYVYMQENKYPRPQYCVLLIRQHRCQLRRTPMWRRLNSTDT